MRYHTRAKAPLRLCVHVSIRECSLWVSEFSPASFSSILSALDTNTIRAERESSRTPSRESSIETIRPSEHFRLLWLAYSHVVIPDISEGPRPQECTFDVSKVFYILHKIENKVSTKLSALSRNPPITHILSRSNRWRVLLRKTGTELMLNFFQFRAHLSRIALLLQTALYRLTIVSGGGPC